MLCQHSGPIAHIEVTAVVTPGRGVILSKTQQWRSVMTLSENHVPIAHGSGFFPHIFEPFKSLGASIAGCFSPSADAIDSYELNIELPGVKEDDIDITLQNGILSIKGEKREEREEKTKSYYFSERSYGRFKRSFRVPSDVVEDKIGAQFGDGVLKVILPRNAPKELAVKKVEIKKQALDLDRHCQTNTG